MRLVLRMRGKPWWVRRMQTCSPVVELSAEEKLRRLVNAALATPYYSRRENAARLLAASHLQELPVTTLRSVLNDVTDFENPKVPAARGLFRPPFATSNCALLGKKLRLPDGVRELDRNAFGRLHLSDTRMLAATPAVLRRICAAIEARQLALPQLCEAVVVLEGMEEGTLHAGERDLLWRALGVPAFEQWLGLDGELLAWECDAHQGLHFNSDKAELEVVDDELVITSWSALRTPILRMGTGWTAEIDKLPCPCGDTRPVLRQITMHKQSLAAPKAHAAVGA